MTTPQPGAGAGQAQSPSLIPSAPTQNSLRPLLLLSASTLKVLPQMPLKSVTPQSCCEVYTQGKGKLSEESLPCSVTLSAHKTRQSSVQGACVDFKTGNAIQPLRRKSLPVMPRASQVDETRHGDTQKAALMEKDSRMVGPGAGSERRQEKENQRGRVGAGHVNPAAHRTETRTT